MLKEQFKDKRSTSLVLPTKGRWPDAKISISFNLILLFNYYLQLQYSY